MASSNSANQYYTKPLERLREERSTLPLQVHNYLYDPYEQDEDSSDEENYSVVDNYASLPPTMDTIRLFSNTDLNTIRKTRPLPKIPDRVSSKQISKDMTLVLTESFKNQNRVSAQQLFQILNTNKSSDDNDDNDSDEGGVYTHKTQINSSLTKKEILEEYYLHDSHSKKLMTPVEEVDEEDFDQPNRLSDSSLSQPSLSSGRTSPHSQKSEENQPIVQQDNNDDDDDVNSFTSPCQSLLQTSDRLYALTTKDENSLHSDVQKLSRKLQESKMSGSFVQETGRSEFSITSTGITHDKEAIKTFRRMATKTNDRHIQFNYAKHLIQLVSLSAKNGDQEVLTRLQEEAEYWIEKLSKSNYASALYIKGQWHRRCGDKKLKSIFVGSQYKKVDHDKAFKCFQQAAKYGCIEAYYELAEYWMVRKEYKKSVSGYKYAAEKGHIPSLYKLSNILLRGLLQQKKNTAQGLVYLRQAADSNKPESAVSAYDFACILSGDLECLDLESNSVIEDIHKQHDFKAVIHYFKKADEFGFVNAAFRLGQIYCNGEKGAPAEPWNAYHYFTKAATQHHEGAMIELSKLYRTGIPEFLKPQSNLAFQWCLRAATNGNEEAEYLLGTYYEQGIGIYPDPSEAHEWYKKSASKEYKPAIEKLNPNSTRNLNHHGQDYNNNKRYYQQSIRINEERVNSKVDQDCPIM